MPLTKKTAARKKQTAKGGKTVTKRAGTSSAAVVSPTRKGSEKHVAALQALLESAKHASVEQIEDSNTLEGTSSRGTCTSSTATRNMTQFVSSFSQAMHAVLQITLIERAQLKILPQPKIPAASPAHTAGSGAPASTDQSQDGTTLTMSVNAEERWLEAVERYSQHSFGLNDLARVAMVFPDVLTVRWQLRDAFNLGLASWRAQQTYLEDEGKSGGSSMRITEKADAQPSQIPPSSDAGRLSARVTVHLAGATLPPPEHFAERLRERLKSVGGTKAQTQWHRQVLNHTALAAYAEQQLGKGSAGSTSCDAKQLGHEEGQSSEDPALHHLSLTTEAAQAMLAKISPALRSSLSENRLKAVVQRMIWDESREEERLMALITQQQARERTLRSYEQLLSIMCSPAGSLRRTVPPSGTVSEDNSNNSGNVVAAPSHATSSANQHDVNGRVQMSYSRLLRLLLAQGEDATTDGIVGQLNQLLSIPVAGVSALRYVNGELVSLSTLDTSESSGLEDVLITLDRSGGSLRALREALEARHANEPSSSSP